MGMGISNEKVENLEEIRNQVISVIEELLQVAKLEEGDIVVIGCSSSEITARKIGTFSSEEVGRTVFEAAYETLKAHKLNLATQCCEHLNRAIIVEKKVAKENRLTIVNVVPQLKAGGSFSTAAYKGFENAVAVESIQAQAGIDIGDTLIGMHLQPVAVPVRTATKNVGDAHVVCARTRAKSIGGERAVYDERLL